MASFKDVAAALGLEPGATPDDAIAEIAKIRAIATGASDDQSAMLDALKAESKALAQRCTAAESRVSDIEERAHAVMSELLDALGLAPGTTPVEARAQLREFGREMREMQAKLARFEPEPAEDGKRYFALTRILGGTGENGLGNYEPGDPLPAHLATKIVRGMTEGEQYRTE